MSIFDKLFNKAADAATGAVKNAVSNAGNKKEEFTFTKLPESLAELKDSVAHCEDVIRKNT